MVLEDSYSIQEVSRQLIGAALLNEVDAITAILEPYTKTELTQLVFYLLGYILGVSDISLEDWRSLKDEDFERDDLNE